MGLASSSNTCLSLQWSGCASDLWAWNFPAFLDGALFAELLIDSV